MKIVTYLMLGTLIFSIFRTHRNVRQAQSPQERGFIIRTSATAWLLGFLFVLALIILPNKAQLMLFPAGFILSVILGKVWHNARNRLRKQSAEKVNLEKMKRVN